MRHPFLQFPRLSLLLTGMLCLAALWPVSRLRLSPEAGRLLQGDRRNEQGYETVRQVLSGTETVLISLRMEDVLSPAGLRQVWRVSEALLGLPQVADVKSLTHAFKPVRQGFGFTMVPLAPAWDAPAAEFEAFRAFCTNHPLVRNLMVSPDGRDTLLTVTLREDWARGGGVAALRVSLQAALEPFRHEGFTHQIIAWPFIEADLKAQLFQDLGRWGAAGAVLFPALLWLAFRSLPLVLLALAELGVGLVLTLALVAVSGVSVSLFSLLLAPLILGVHMTLVAHLFSTCQAARGEVGKALGTVWQPSVLAAVTTLFGLASLGFCAVEEVRNFGLLGSAALLIVFGVTFGPGIAALEWWARGWRRNAAPEREANTLPAPARLTRITAWLAPRRHAVLGFTLATVLLAAPTLVWLRTDMRPVEFLDARSPLRQTVEALDRAYGGINVTLIRIDTSETDGVKRLPFLRYLDRLHEFATRQPGVSGVYSYAQLLAMMNQIWEEGRPEALHLPDNPLTLQLFFLALRMDDFPFLATLVDPAGRSTSLVVRTHDLPARDYLKLIEAITASARRDAPPGVTVSAAEGLHAFLETDRQVTASLYTSAGSTLAMIGLLLLVRWRSLKLAAFSLLAVSAPLACALAAASLVGVPLNSITIMVAAVACGTAVDNSIHLIDRWQEGRRAGLVADVAAAAALRQKAAPVWWTSAMLLTASGLLLTSAFPPVRHLGLLCGCVYAGTLLVVLLVLPVALSVPVLRD